MVGVGAVAILGVSITRCKGFRMQCSAICCDTVYSLVRIADYTIE